MSQKIVVLGVGGHGWESLKDVISKSDNVVLYGTTVDWGGFTGSWGRLLEMNDNRLNKMLHFDAIPVLPYGDFNKIIAHFIQQESNKEIANVLSYRSYSIDGHFQEFLKLIEPFSLNIDQVSAYLTYLKTFFDYLEQYHYELNYSKEPCLGTIFHSFIAGKGGLDNINAFYHRLNIIPQSISLAFASKNRQTLIGKTNELELIGEDIIDVISTPIEPASLQLREIDLSPCNLEANLLIDLQQADMILIPNGSIANWLPLVNCHEIQYILKSKTSKVVCMLNLFYTTNEYPINIYIQYLDSIGIKPIVVLPNMTVPIVSSNLIQRYKLEGKTINYPEFLQKVIDFVSDATRVHSVSCDQNLTFKYNSHSVASSLLGL